MPDTDIVQPETSVEELKEIYTREVYKQRIELDKLFQSNPYLKFVPHGGQEDFLKGFYQGLKDERQIFLSGSGNGWGKTWMLLNLIWNLMCHPKERNPWFANPVLDTLRGPPRYRLISHSKQLQEPAGEIHQAIAMWWPKRQYYARKGSYDYPSIYKCHATGITLDVMTSDQDPKDHESASLRGVFMDEPPDYNIFSRYPTRLRHGGFICIVATLLNCEWAQSEILENPNAYVRFGDTHENCSSCGTRGYLRHNDIERMFQGVRFDEIECRRTGRPSHMAGRAFPIDDQVHIRSVDIPDDPPTPDQLKEIREKYPRRALVLDPHDSKPWAIAVIGVNQQNHFMVLDEWPKPTETNNMYYHKVHNYNVGYGFYADVLKRLIARWDIKYNIIDAKFAAHITRSDAFAQSLRSLLMKDYGLFFHDGNTNVEGDRGGRSMLTELLSFDSTQPVTYLNRPRFYINMHCRNTIYGLVNIANKKSRDPLNPRTELDPKLLDFPRLCMYGIMDRYLNAGVETKVKQEFDWKTASEDWLARNAR